MYFERADLWPVLTPPEGYLEEMQLWCEAIEEDRRRLLDLGTGGGHHLNHLLNWRPLVATAVDLSPRMLELSARLNPSVTHLEGDMLSLRLEQRFDVVTVHDSLTYLTSGEQIRQLLATVHHHLEPGGLLLFAPDYLREGFQGPYRSLTHNKNDQIEVTLTHYEFDPDPADNLFEAVYVYFVQRGCELEVHQERQVLGLFDKDQWLSWTEQAGFEVQLLDYDLWEHQTFLFRALKK